jgi:type II secretory pathway pseudopilin PulG
MALLKWVGMRYNLSVKLSIRLSRSSVAARKAGSSAAQAERSAGFTILEVMLAAVILVVGITSAITTLQTGLRAVDNARNYSTAAQLMQNEMERLRLKSWTQLQSLQESGNTSVAVPASGISSRVPFACTRQIRDVKPDMKEIALVSNWQSYDGHTHTVQLVTRYSKTGLYDYFYTAH